MLHNSNYKVHIESQITVEEVVKGSVQFMLHTSFLRAVLYFLSILIYASNQVSKVTNL